MLNYGISHFDFYEIIFFIIIYSFLGWCCEVIYAFKNQRKFINRGFLHGPLCPIYGAGLVSLILLLDSFKGNLFVLFIVATTFISFIEYFTGFLLEKIFKTKYWDYTDDPLNINGRICLHFSLMWGAVSLAIVKIIHPIVSSIVDSIPTSLGVVLVYILLISVIIDFSRTLLILIDFRKITNNFQIDNNFFGSKYNSFFQIPRSKNFNDIFDNKFQQFINKIIKRNDK